MVSVLHRGLKTIYPMPSLFRRLTHEALQTISFPGDVVDLGGSKTSEYMHIVKKTAKSVTVINLDSRAQPDLFADLEKRLPCTDQCFDTVLAMNVFEHIYHYQQLLDESSRVLRPHGELVIVVPFLFQIHPSPNDYFRYTRQTWVQLLTEHGFESVVVREIGTGVWAARYQLLHNFLPTVFTIPLQWLAMKMDHLWTALAQKTGKKYTPDLYPLGYLVQARKKSI